MKTELPETEKWERFITESGLSRVLKHIQKNDSAILTGFRSDASDLSKCRDEAASVQTLGNKERNRDIKAHLLQRRYGVTSVDGSYIEDFETPLAKEVREASFFVVNLNNDPNFEKEVLAIGEKFCQDAVLFIPQGGQNAVLVGTNNSDFPGYGNKVPVGNLKMGQTARFMTKVKNRPFTMTESLETYKKLSRLEKMAVEAIVKGTEWNKN